MDIKTWTPKDWAAVLGALATVAVIYFRVGAVEQGIEALNQKMEDQSQRVEQLYVRKDVFDSQMRLIDLQIQAANLRQETR